MKVFAKQLRQERELHSWSQEQVAEMVGTTAPNVSRWERGITLPSFYFRQKLCELFGKSAEELGVLESANNNDAQAPDQGGEEQHITPSSQEVSSLFWNLPHQRNPLFTGREETLLSLHQALNSGDAGALTQVQAISGLGGIGKTALALEYAYHYGEEYRVILWIRAETRDGLLSDLSAVARLLTSTEQEQAASHQAVGTVKRWLEQYPRWLLIVDNLEEFALLGEILPLKSLGHILVTTRSQFTGSLMQRLDLQKLSPDEGALFLLRRAKRLGPSNSLEQATPADRTTATKISHLLDGLPLALDQAGAYIEEAACSLAHYFHLLQRHRAMLLNLRNLSGREDAEHPHSVYATFTLSFERIKRANPAAIDLLQLCTFLHPDAIPEEMITDGAPDLGPLLQGAAGDPLKYDAMMAELRRYSLLQRNPDTGTFSIHRLVQGVIKDTMDEAVQRQWAQRAVQMINHIYPRVDQWVTSSLCQRYFPHAQVCAALIEEWDIVCLEAGQLLTRLVGYMYELLQYDFLHFAQAEPFLQKAQAIFTQISEAESPEAADVYQLLGWVYTIRGNYAQAEIYHQQALTIFERSQSPDQYDRACYLSDLAEVYWEQGKYASAEPLYQQALAISEQLWGSEDLNVATDLRNLGVCYCDQGKYDQAKPLLLRTFDISQKVLGIEHPFTAGILHALGGFYLEQKEYAQAEPLLLQALEIRQKLLKPEHPYIAFSLHALGRFYLEQKEYAQAEPLLLQAIEISQKALGPAHPKTVPFLNNLALLYSAKGDDGEAEALFQRAIEISQKTLEPEPRQTAQRFHDLTVDLPRFGRARKLSRPAMEMDEGVYR